MYGYIYKTTDLSNGKIYVGLKTSTTFLSYKYLGSGLIITRIVSKCRKQNVQLESRFNIELLEECLNRDELNQREQFWIRYLDAQNPNIGYNIALGGADGGPLMLGHKHSEATKQKMHEDRLGEKNSNYGNRWKQSEELKQLHSRLSSGENNGMFGKKHTEESRAKNSESHKGKIAVSFVETDAVKMIYPDELEHYLELGWIKKNIHRKGNNR